MLVDNKYIAFQVLQYLTDIDAYMVGHHEVEFKKVVNNLSQHPRLCASVIAQSLSFSPLYAYEFKYLENGEWVKWVPFESNICFPMLLKNRRLDVSIVEKNSHERQIALQELCLRWCRRLIFKGVESRNVVKKVANA